MALQNTILTFTLCSVVAMPTLAQSQQQVANSQAQPRIIAANDEYLQLPGADQPYTFQSRDQDVQDALRLFGRNLEINTAVDEKIKGTLAPRSNTSISRIDYLDDLAGEFGFVWYFDGKTLHVSDASSIATEIIALQNYDGSTVINILRELDIHQDKFTHRSDLRNRTFLVSGPSDYVELVKKAVESIEAADRRRVTILRGSTEDNQLAIAPVPDTPELEEAPVQ